MKFSEKFKRLRKSKGLNQSELGEKIGISVRSIYKYETDQAMPRRKEIYKNLAEFFNVPIEFLKEDKEDDFEVLSACIDGDNGRKEAEKIIEEVRGLFSGGKISESDRDGLMKTLQEIYWETKEIQQNREKERAEQEG